MTESPQDEWASPFQRPEGHRGILPRQNELEEAGYAALRNIRQARQRGSREALWVIWNERGVLWRFLVLRGLWWVVSINNLLLAPLLTLLFCDLVLQVELPAMEPVYLGIGGMFLLEWLWGLAMARSRRDYLTNLWLCADLVSALPLSAFFQSARLFRLARWLRVFDLLHVLRARRLPFPVGRIAWAFGVLLSVIGCGTVALLAVEPETLSTWQEALWFSLVTVTTVGFGDVTPGTPAGRAVASLLMFTSVGLLSYLAGLMATSVRDPEQELLIETVTRLETKLDALLAERATLGEPG